MTSTRRKIEALRDLIQQIQLELGTLLVDDLNNDQVVIGRDGNEEKITLRIDWFVDIMEKWNRLQNLAHEKDERLKENRKKWKQFKRQLEDLEQATEQFSNMDDLCKSTNTSSFPFASSIQYLPASRTVYSKADNHRDSVHRLGTRRRISIRRFHDLSFQMNYKHYSNRC